MKIVHLIYSFNTGGAQTMLVDIANEQVKKAEVSIVIINKKFSQQLVEKINNRVKVYFIGREESNKNPYPIVKLNLLLLKIGANVLHCHNHNIVPLLIPSQRKNAVLTLHCLGIPTKYLSKYNKLFAISEAVKNDVEVRICLDVKVIYNGISTALIKSKVNYSLKPKFRMISVGRLEHLTKGQHLAIEALHILKLKGINNIQLDFIGAGSSEQFLKKLTRDYELTNCVDFLGLKDRDYIYGHIKDYDLLIQPSIYEGFGLTVAEGMAARIPVLVSDVEGPMEVIDKGKYGYYFEVGNVERLTEQIEYIMSISNTDQLIQKVNDSYKHVIENLDVSSTAAKYLQNY